MALLPFTDAVVTKIEQANANTRRFFLQFTNQPIFDFKPGQFITMDLPIDEKKNKRWRSYSIASAPNGTNTIELVIVLLEGGRGTTYLFNEVKEGSILSVRGPQGVFILPETLDKDLYLICTGTGIAPFKSMVQHIFNKQIEHKNIYLIFGCRKMADTLYQEELTCLEKQLPNFHYLPTYSRETENNAVYKGYVHSLYERLVADNHKPNASFFLCGWKQMIDEARQRIAALGYDKKNIHFELYG